MRSITKDRQAQKGKEHVLETRKDQDSMSGKFPSTVLFLPSPDAVWTDSCNWERDNYNQVVRQKEYPAMVLQRR